MFSMRKFKILFLVLLSCSAVLYSQPTQDVNREVLTLNRGWRFHLGDIVSKIQYGHSESYNNSKTGSAQGAASPEFDDTEWRVLNLPHDWSVESGFDSTMNVSQGYRHRGIGWYRRRFSMDDTDRGKSVELQFDGISTYATIWINGILIHRNWCGYTSSYIDITSYLRYGDELNTIAVRVDAASAEGWFYEGAGIYRHTWLVKTQPIHIATDGVYANPIKIKNTEWLLPVEVTVKNNGNKRSTIEIISTLLDASGKEIVKNSTQQFIPAFSEKVSKFSLMVSNPNLWSIEEPTLYKVKTMIKQNGNLIDEVITNCGFRTLRFTADAGFFLNDKPLKIKGTCNHQDHAGVGVAVPEALLEFRIKKLKEMGSNAYRSSHNPPAKELLDICDRLGMMVIVESRNFNVSPEYQRQYEWMVRRDRNHPSVFMWSIFNEEPLQGTEIGFEMAQRAKAFVNSLDTTRAVTGAMHNGFYSPINSSQALDVMGFNYNINDYDTYHKQNPTVPMLSTEDVSALAQRGVWKTDKNRNMLSDYDTEKVRWGDTNRAWWKVIDQRPYLAGCFVWTGFDYRGEPTPYKWPTASSNFGNLDLCGFPKSGFYVHQALWTSNPVLKLVPHWNWPKDSIGKAIRVMAYTNLDSVALFLNGKFQHAQKIDKYDMGDWLVAFKPGKLEAKGYKNGKLVMSDKVETTGKPVALQLIPFRKTLVGNGQDATPITVQVVDEKGRLVQNANFMVDFEINGPAQNIGVGNGDPNCHESEKANQRSLYNGLAQLIIQSKENSKGIVTVVARAKGMKDAVLQLEVKDTLQIPSVNIAKPKLELAKWRVSQLNKTKPDATIEIADFDMNSWENFKPGQTRTMIDKGYLIFRTQFTPFSIHQKEGAKIILKNMTGKAEIWLDNILVYTKTTATSEYVIIPFVPKRGIRKLVVVSEGEKNNTVGLGASVTIE